MHHSACIGALVALVFGSKLGTERNVRRKVSWWDPVLGTTSRTTKGSSYGLPN